MSYLFPGFNLFSMIDAEAPIITQFMGTGPDPTMDPVVPFNLTATDDIGVTAWMITDTPTVPLPRDSGWLPTQPTSYTITTGDGIYELYAWARDRAGNVSAVTDESHFMIEFRDMVAPIVAQFNGTGPNPTQVNTVPVAITATDNVAITGWMITESSVQPASANPGWLAVQPSSYILSGSFGTYDLYLWVRDLAGNVSVINGNSHFTIVYGDMTEPVVSQFVPAVNPTSQAAATVTITASDNIAVTAWMITESPVQPLPVDPGWQPVQPTTYTLAGYGTYDLYAWVMDGSGNVSVMNASSHFTITYIQPYYYLQTGQVTCYDGAGNPLGGGCAGSGQDGEFQRSLAWLPATRFTNNGLTITDNTTGLIWAANGDLTGGPVTWQNALAYIDSMNMSAYGGRTDWRLPNILEIISLRHYGGGNVLTWLTSFGFANLSTSLYWSSTTNQINRTQAWCYHLQNGYKTPNTKDLTRFVMAVSSGSTVLSKTGQTLCYDPTGVTQNAVPCAGSGQDGEFQMGLAWPAPRFTNKLDGTITDNLTGLMWPQDLNLMVTTYPSYDTDDVLGDGMITNMTAYNFISFINSMNYCGHNDWRLPNHTELSSVANHGADATWLSSMGFTNYAIRTYWSSTTGLNLQTAYTTDIPNSSTYYADKTTLYRYVWPVRGGY